MSKQEYITLEPAALIFVLVSTVSFAISIPLAVKPMPQESDRVIYGGPFYAGGSVGGILRTLMTSQAQFQANCVIDEDQDGTGEYGLLSDLGGAPLRNGRPPCSPTYITSIFARPGSNGFFAKSGFYYRSYVPNDPDLAERCFVILAWPIRRGSTGWNTYLLTAGDEIRVWIGGDKTFSGNDAPTLEDVFFGEPWVTPIDDYNWADTFP